MIDRETTQKILDAANIVDVVSEFVVLKKAGTSYKGLCPFHSDSTPSFSVSPAKNICHCFACGKGGNPVNFIMEHEQMSYPEALRWLANKYHIEIKERELTDEERQQDSERESMFIVNEFAAKYYHDILKNNPDGIAIGMQYFRSRGFRDDIIEKFRLGFSLSDRYALPRTAKQKGYKDEFLVKTGLCYGDGALVDRYAGRAIFPWITMSGKVVAFGGRVLDSRTKGVKQKYVNSPESIIYHKERELYGIFQAKRAIAKEDCVFMVEGYTDVIAMHQCGIENVVANSGTALSKYQITMLHRLTNNITLLYDGDEAGIHAALRGTDMLLEEGMNIKVLLLPDGDDPDSFSRKHSAEEFKEYVNSHQTDFIQFQINVRFNTATDPIKRSEAISNIVKSISFIPDPIIRDTYIHESAAKLHMREETLISSMNKFIKERRDMEFKRRQRTDNGQTATTGAAPSADNNPSSDIGQFDGPPSPEDFEIQRETAERGSADSQRQRNDAQVPQQPNAPSSPAAAPTAATLTPLQKVERMLIQEIVRHGEEFAFDNIELEDGSVTSLTVAEYIRAGLDIDSLELSTPIYRTILDEAVAKSRVEGWVAAPYFSQNPDINISQVASSMIIDRYSLSKSLELHDTKETISQRVEHLLMEFRMQYVEMKLKELNSQLALAKDYMDKSSEILKEVMMMQKLRSALARQLGRNIR